MPYFAVGQRLNKKGQSQSEPVGVFLFVPSFLGLVEIIPCRKFTLAQLSIRTMFVCA
jgi:hypothetical protein